MKLSVITITVTLLTWMAVLAVAEDDPDCPKSTVINNGVCRDNEGKDCSTRESQSPVCFSPDPTYTEEAAKERVKATVRLKAVIESNGCAVDIEVVQRAGYGLDEAAVSALQRWRFRKRTKPTPITVEFNFDPQVSSRKPLAAPNCAGNTR